MNRLTAKSYSDGTPVANFWYDYNAASLGNWTQGSLANTKGRLYAACTSNAIASCPAGYTGTVYSYDAMGRIVNYWQATPLNEGSSAWQMTYNYDLAGDVTSWTHPAGFTLTNTINDAQQITQIQSSLVDSTHPQYPAQNITYTPWGAENTLENGCAGSGCTDVLESYTYNLRLQPITINLGTPSNPSAYYCLVYNFYANSYYPNSCSPTPQNWGGDDGMLWNAYYGDNVNPSLSHTELYYYDGLKRLTTAQATGNSTYNLTFAYDRYGNMTCQTNGQTQGLCPNYSFDQTTNRINTPGFQYDAAGNLTLDNNQHAYQWDAENRPISLQGTPVTFNAFGEMASFVFPWTNVYYLYDPAGNPIGMAETGGEMWRQFIPLHGRSQAVYSTGSQEMYFLHPNLLGSVTMNTNQTGAPVGDLLIYPWGQPWTSAGDLSVWQYAQFQNDKSLIDPTPTRWDDPGMGRWLSADPLGGDISNPQSLNRYAYVLNSPTTLTDPSGLGPCDNLQYGQGKGLCQTDVNGVIAAATTFGPSSWDPFELMDIPVVTQTWTPGTQVGTTIGGITTWGPISPGSWTTTQVGTGFDLFGGLIGQDANFLGRARSSPLPQTQVPSNPCAYQGRALSPSDYATSGKAVNGHPIDFALDVFMGWPKGDYLDAQPFASGNVFQRQAYGNYVFGVYMAATGVPLSTALFGASTYAFFFSSYSKNTSMDPNYGSLPAANVVNVSNGYNAYLNGTMCHN